MIEIASIVLAGFSVVSALLLLSAWLIALDFPTHTPHSVAVTTALMSAFVIIGLAHIHWLLGGPAPLELLHYRLCLFAAPALFYLFCRSAIVPEAPIHATQALHLAPMLIALFAPIELGLPALLLIGVGY
ncbi:MAG: hypothetical protein MK142_05485, partial [Pseudomonadales bacterium]|nr:hypothetical protein [Pseudomonadales bacterium]